jgi:tRNA threonylcarbamoyl adenosine modification protein (Sua5/YciO/YrdC/YwlC family)
MAKLVKIYPQNPSEREIEKVVKVLENDGLVIYPTDGVYAFGCLLRSAKAVERLRALSGKEEKLLSIVCSDISMVDKFARIDNTLFKILKRNTPGPFTFILED